MQFLIKSILILSLMMLSSCATDPFHPLTLVEAERAEIHTREGQLIKSVETMHVFNQDLHKKVAEMTMALALLRVERDVLLKQLDTQKKEDHAKYIELYSLLKMREKALDECIGAGFEVLIKPRAVKEKKFDNYDTE